MKILTEIKLQQQDISKRLTLLESQKEIRTSTETTDTTIELEQCSSMAQFKEFDRSLDERRSKVLVSLTFI